MAGNTEADTRPDRVEIHHDSEVKKNRCTTSLDLSRHNGPLSEWALQQDHAQKFGEHGVPNLPDLNFLHLSRDGYDHCFLGTLPEIIRNPSVVLLVQTKLAMLISMLVSASKSFHCWIALPGNFLQLRAGLIWWEIKRKSHHQCFFSWYLQTTLHSTRRHKSQWYYCEDGNNWTSYARE